jgi:hypothetical protein
MLVQKVDAELFWPPLFTASACPRAVIDAALMERAFTG